MNAVNRWPENDPALAIFKVGPDRHMTELLSQGHVYMNAAAYFAGLEDERRSDRYEGASFCLQGKGTRVDMQAADGGFRPLGHVVGKMVAKSDDLLNTNVYCLHARRRSHGREPFRLDRLRLGESAILFIHFDEFIRRLKRSATAAGHTVRHGLVSYVDPESYQGPMDLFTKFASHRAQSEWRIAVAPGIGAPLSLHLGGLSDIAIKLSTSGHLKLIPR